MSTETTSNGDLLAQHKPTAAGQLSKVTSVLILNASMAGIQFAFAIMSTVVNPLLSYLGLSETDMKYVNLIGPIVGFFVQPIFGAWSDHCTFKYGRRRIFIMSGCAAVLIALCFIGYCRLMSESGAIAIAIVGVALLNISVNVMMCPARAIVSDLVTAEAQNRGQVFASFMMGASFLICNMIVFGLSFQLNDGTKADISICPPDDVFDTEELAIIIVSIGIVIIFLCLWPTMIYGREIRYEASGIRQRNIFYRMFKAIGHMPKPIRRSCIVFLGSWAGYYPFQVFSSHIYGLQLGALATSVGSLVTLIFSTFLDRITKRFGLKWPYVFSQGFAAAAMISMFGPYFKTRGSKGENVFSCDDRLDSGEVWIQIVVCILVGIIGLNNSVMNSIPFAIVGKYGGESKGLYMGILNCCCVIAQCIGMIFDLIWTAIFESTIEEGEDDMLVGMGPIVACAIFATVGFGLTFLLHDGKDEQEERFIGEVDAPKSESEERFSVSVA